MSIKITKKQRQILDFITEFTTTHGISPSYREIMHGLGLSSVSSVAEHINNLVQKGALKKSQNTSRSLEVVDLTFPETTDLITRALVTATPEEADILYKAADILGVEL